MMYRYVLRLDIDEVDREGDRILNEDKSRRVYARAYIDPSMRCYEPCVIGNLCESILEKLRETT